MEGYTKLFSEILASSIWGEEDRTRIVWITLLALRGSDNIARASLGGLAHQARVSREACEKAVQILSSPDSDSRSKEYDGRRIQEVEGGFMILNGEKFKTRRDGESRKVYMREYMQRRRQERKQESKQNKQPLAFVSPAEQSRAEQSKEHPIDPIRSVVDSESVNETKVIDSREVRRIKRPNSVEEFIAGAATIGIMEQDLRDQYALWDIANWHNGYGQPVLDWKRALVSLKQKNLLPSQIRREPELRTVDASQAAFQPSLEWIVAHFKQKTRGMNYMPVSRYCHDKLLARGYIWHKQPLRDEEHARAVLSDIAEEYARKA